MNAAIVDIGSGNLRSLSNALRDCGCTVTITNDPKVVASADRLVLPGQGAFAPAMKELRDRGLEEAIKTHVWYERPLLGICLGSQVLLDWGDEGGHTLGIGLVRGHVTKLERKQLPHMGWATVEWIGPYSQPMEGMSADYYFAHSYEMRVYDDRVRLSARAMVNDVHGYPVGYPMCAGFVIGNLHAYQFHPEKSQRAGSDLLKGWLSL